MWVADMDFKTAPEIIEALQKRVGHGVFGYTVARIVEEPPSLAGGSGDMNLRWKKTG